MNRRVAVFPGSFDPFTKGHEDIVLRSLSFLDQVVIAIGNNASKKRYFGVELMYERIAATFEGYPQVEVEVFQGLTGEFARRKGADLLLRGLRNTTDFEYENSIAQSNRQVFEGMETVLLITSPNLAYISSSVVRDLHRHGAPVEDFLPYRLPEDR